MTKLISEIVTEASNAEKAKDKVKILQSNDSPALREVLKFLFHPDVKLYTSTPPEYNKDPAPVGYSYQTLYNVYRKFYIFTENYVLKKERKDQLLTEILESIDTGEASLLHQRFSGKLLLRLNKKIINEAFPGLIP